MTRDEIMNMPAGKDLSALVAAIIFDWHYDSGGAFFVPPDGDKRRTWAAEWDDKGYPNWMPDYSESISAAWEIVDRMKRLGWRYYCRDIDNEINYKPSHASEFQYGDVTGIQTGWIEADTIPLSICRAALLAVMDNK